MYSKKLQPAARVVANTAIQYTRVFITMGLSLYTVRLLLQALGAADYGIFNLIGGVVAMFAFFNGAMAASTQRFLSFHQGRNSTILIQQKIFSNGFLLHLAAAVIIVAALEFAGQFLFHGFLNIATQRLRAAHIVYHAMCAGIFFTVLSIPFTAVLIAHENILGIALLNTADIVLKFLAAIWLFLIKGDSLLIYGFFIAFLSLVSLLLVAFYCFSKYPECTVSGIARKDNALIKEMTSFAGWNLLGALCSLARYEGLAIVLNLFFGTVINAAFGIANQVAGQLAVFSITILRVITPQIIKSEGNGNRQRMLRLSMTASKFGFYLLAGVAIPCIFEMPAILAIWLQYVPDSTVVFCRLVLIGALANQLTIGLEAALQAVGNIRFYQAIVGGLLLLNIPLAYLLLKAGLPAHTVLLSYIVVELFACAIRLQLTKTIAGLSIRLFFARVLMKEILPLVVITITCFFIVQYTNFHYRFLFTGSAAVLSFSLSIYLVGLQKDERSVLQQNLYTFAAWLRRRKKML